MFGTDVLKPVGQAFARALLALGAGAGTAGPSASPGREEAGVGTEPKCEW